MLRFLACISVFPALFPQQRKLRKITEILDIVVIAGKGLSHHPKISVNWSWYNVTTSIKHKYGLEILKILIAKSALLAVTQTLVIENNIDILKNGYSHGHILFVQNLWFDCLMLNGIVNFEKMKDTQISNGQNNQQIFVVNTKAEKFPQGTDEFSCAAFTLHNPDCSLLHTLVNDNNTDI